MNPKYGTKRYEKITIFLREKDSLKTVLEAMFNPAEYTVAQEAKYSNKEESQPAFLGEEFLPLQLSLFFDTFDTKQDVRLTYTNKLAELTRPAGTGTDGKQPPICVVLWGSMGFEGRVQKVEQKFTLFLPDGTPVRATVNLTITPTATPREVEVNMGLEACRKLWTVKSGDRLDLIAYRMLADSAKWRKIAETNQIMDPLRFPTHEDIGRVIVIPD